jgi:hypothetical protein
LVTSKKFNLGGKIGALKGNAPCGATNFSITQFNLRKRQNVFQPLNQFTPPREFVARLNKWQLRDLAEKLYNLFDSITWYLGQAY